MLPVQDNAEEPDPATLVGVRIHVSPVGETVVVRLTTPPKLWSGVRVIVELPADPALTVTVVGLAAMVKSCTV